jgi:hypothetical protein
MPTASPLGPLTQLPGTWSGSGFNVVARPNKQQRKLFELELNQTSEILTFESIGSSITNRGSIQGDIDMFGLHYLQRVNDAVTHNALHLEPGLWLTVPPTRQPPAPQPTLVRLATIPHGDALLAQGFARVQGPGLPVIDGEDTTPLHSDSQQPVTAEEHLRPFRQRQATAPNITRADIKNPNRILTAAIRKQDVISTTMLTVDTAFAGPAQPGDIRNIPFIRSNADAISMKSVLWIEEISHPVKPGTFLQLQYSQRVILRFRGIDWPHVSVATLIKT